MLHLKDMSSPIKEFVNIFVTGLIQEKQNQHLGKILFLNVIFNLEG